MGIQSQRLPGRRKLHPVPGGGGGEEKSCVSFQPEGAASPRHLPVHRPPPGEDFWVVSFALSGFHFLVEASKLLGILKTLHLVEG